MFGGDTKKEYYIARKHVFVFKVSLFYFFLFFQTSTRENVTFECDKKKKLFFPFFLSLLSFCVFYHRIVRPLQRWFSFLFSIAKKALCRHKKFITSLSHQYHVFGRNARAAPFDGAAAKTKRREEEFIIIFVPVKSSDGDRGGVDVHLRDGDIRGRETKSSSSAAG